MYNDETCFFSVFDLLSTVVADSDVPTAVVISVSKQPCLLQLLLQNLRSVVEVPISLIRFHS
ncbi:hypothetical protein SB659_19310, partial [Arthrobacter sp. SIMBA_036]|uniref:hypothetical protein n=1 Tax=Arthrobacter sp. SIMBA_036 TaxID=3085778 RepID=UPI003978385D